MWSAISALPGILGLLLFYFLIQLYKHRQQMQRLPSPPMPSKILGHLPIAAECTKHFPPNTHPHAWCHYIQKKYNLGKFFYIDLWPLGPRQLYIADPEMASQYATSAALSLQKSPLFADFLAKLLGPNNMVTLEGHTWKKVRTMYNPGFATGHLMTLVPYIVDASVTFANVMRQKAKTGELFQMEEYATRLTVDIIGKVVLDVDFNAQLGPNPIVDAFRKQVTLMPPADMANPFQNLNLLREFRIWSNGRQLDRLIGEELDKRFAGRGSSPPSQAVNGSSQEKGSKANRKRSVVDLALDMYHEEFQNATQEPSTKAYMDASFRSNAIQQIKTFIFAGHDTTSSTIAYIFYLLHFHRAAHARVVAELDSVLGRDRSAGPALLKADPHLVNNLPYCTAVLKEVLRLFPPASTMRWTQPAMADAMLTDPDTGLTYPLAGFHIWPVSHAIHRNEAYFPRPTHFIPERFLPDETPFPLAQVSKEAWRPFEKGPRHCIGQELALLETKIIMALTLREFDFRAEYPPVDGWDGGDGGTRVFSVDERSNYTIEGHRCFQILKGSAKPLDGIPGRIALR